MSELTGEVFLNVQCFVQLALLAKYLISGHWGPLLTGQTVDGCVLLAGVS